MASQPLDIVVTDIVMPEVDGTEVVMGIRRLDPGLPIIAMSGSMHSCVYLKTAKILGAHRTLTKPFTLKQFLAAAHAVLKGEP